MMLRRDTEHHSQLGFQLNTYDLVSLDLLRIKLFHSLTQVVTLIRVFLNCIKKKKGVLEPGYYDLASAPSPVGTPMDHINYMRIMI